MKQSRDNQWVFRRFVVILVLAGMGFAAEGRAQSPATGEGQSEVKQGIALYNAGDAKGAIKLLKSGLKKDKNLFDGWHNLGLAQYKVGDWKEARKAFAAAVKLNPEYLPSRLSLAHLYLLGNDLSKAEAEAGQILAKAPENSDANYIVGTVKLRNNEAEVALEAAERALASNTDFAPALYLRTQALFKQFAKKFLENVEPPAKKDHKRNYGLLQEASVSLEKYIGQLPPGSDPAFWREQLETLRYYAKRAEDGDTNSIVSSSQTPIETIRPKVLHQAKAKYTDQARGNGVQGTVTVLCVFESDATIKHTLVLQGLSHGLTQQAVLAMKEIRFTPATREGKPVPMIVTLEYAFHLY